MSLTPTPSEPQAAPKRWWQRVILQILRLVAVGLVVGWAYAWAAPVVYRGDATPGFWLGTAHGALMPMALPSLLMGKDVPIYAIPNQGRRYKIGYIAGINACGFVVFGLSFWNPKRKPGQ